MRFGANGGSVRISPPIRGKTVNVLIGVGVGGEYDLQARLVARHLGKHIPGNPNVVPQNMVGAGSLRLANVLYNVAPKASDAILNTAYKLFPESSAAKGKGKEDGKPADTQCYSTQYGNFLRGTIKLQVPRGDKVIEVTVDLQRR